MTWTAQSDEAIRRAAAEKVMGWRVSRRNDGYSPAVWLSKREPMCEAGAWQPDRDLNQLAEVFRAALGMCPRHATAAGWRVAARHVWTWVLTLPPREALCALLDALEIPEPEPEPEPEQ